MYYKQYTITKTIQYPVFFKCEHCGKYNLSLQPFQISSSYDDKGVWTERGQLRRETEAYNRLNSYQAKLFPKIEKRTKKRDFQNVDYTCVCSQCQTKPKWSFFKNKTIESLYRIAQVAAFFLTLYALMIVSDEGFSIRPFLQPLGAFGIVYIPRFILYYFKKQKIKQIDEEYMPIICETLPLMAEALRKRNLEFLLPKKAPEPESKKPAREIPHQWLCGNCNTMRSQTPCEHCGHE